MPRKLYAFVLSALFVFSTSTFAEVETTSSIRGIVNVSGAEVTVTHVPTGTKKTRTANEDGLFFVSDLLIGGPYEINASASGYQSQSQSGLYLVLNKTAAVEITLVSNNMEEIGVTASATSGMIRMGGGISLGEDAIAGVPTINRSIADYAKFDPRVSINTESSKNSSITVMGAHERFNDFSVDGVSFNDPFGLNDNGFGSMRNPISMEFVDQISVDITPYDVSRGNTTGGSIATVTKSGSNEFHGSVFFIERDEDDVGELFGQDFAEFSEETKGFTFSGPIIEDKLFFFVGYEEFESGLPALYGAADSNFPNKAESATEADIAELVRISKDRYGFDPGEFTGFTAPETGEKTIIKLNANINDMHRAVFLYQSDEDSLPAGGYNRFSSNWVYYAPEIERNSVDELKLLMQNSSASYESLVALCANRADIYSQGSGHNHAGCVCCPALPGYISSRPTHWTESGRADGLWGDFDTNFMTATLCEAGTYTATYGQTECSVCGKNTYATAGSTTCLDCPIGRETATDGTGSKAECCVENAVYLETTEKCECNTGFYRSQVDLLMNDPEFCAEWETVFAAARRARRRGGR